MENTIDLKKFRIKKKHHLSGNSIAVRYYPQYKSKLLGWRYLSTDKLNIKIGHFLGAHVLGFLLMFFATISFFIGVVFLFSPFLISSIVMIILPILSLYFLLIIYYKTTVGDFIRKNFLDVDGAKNYLMKIVEKERKHKELKNNIPDDEIYFLNVQVERYHKLKKLG